MVNRGEAEWRQCCDPMISEQPLSESLLLYRPNRLHWWLPSLPTEPLYLFAKISNFEASEARLVPADVHTRGRVCRDLCVVQQSVSKVIICTNDSCTYEWQKKKTREIRSKNMKVLAFPVSCNARGIIRFINCAHIDPHWVFWSLNDTSKGYEVSHKITSLISSINAQSKTIGCVERHLRIRHIHNGRLF